MKPTELPTAVEVRELLEGMLGRDVEMTVVGEKVSPESPGCVVGEYIDVMGKVHAVVAAELDIAAYMGAAIALIPAGGAEASIEDGFLSSNLRENFSEVLNVMASLFNKDDSIHLKLDTVADQAQAPISGAAERLMSGFGPALCMNTEVKGYGKGLVSVLLS